MADYDLFLKKVNDFHGDTCMGIALGTRMTLAAMRHLGLDPHQKNKNLIAYVEIDRCMTDAVLVITGCSTGRRSLKLIDYGKFAATLINQATGKAVRVALKQSFNNQGAREETLRRLSVIPDDELLKLQEVAVHISQCDLPGPPRKRAVCSTCGEVVMDGRDVSRDDVVLCRGCARGTYYTTTGV